MPILEPAQAGSDLCQGDLLTGVHVFQTGPDGRAAAITNLSGVLVVSRECALANKDSVVVAGVRTYVEPIKTEATLDHMRRFMEVLRDGGAQPDTFYLGSLPKDAKRLCAKLDMLFTIQIESDVKRRLDWLAEHRAGTLSRDFVRALPVRLFWSVARVGFDDHEWYSTPDLKLVLAAGNMEMRALEATQDEAQVAANQAAGRGDPPAKLAKMEQEVTKAKAAVSELQSRMAPFEAELARRNASPSYAEQEATGPATEHVGAPIER